MGRQSGRRPGKQDTRGQILRAARAQFAQHGYDGASVRRIALAAGVDPALVHHYFGSKENLFQQVLDVPVRPGELVPEVFAEGPENAPENLVRTFLGVWEHPVTGPAMAGVLRTAVSDGVTSRLVREFWTTRVVRAVVHQLGDRVSDEEAALRVSLVASQLLGLALTRYVLRFEPLAGAEQETVVRAVAPTVRRYLFGALTAADLPPEQHPGSGGP
ncbi:TetR family transcriptional regulator [Kocuria sp. M1R5S2]|uniref:TetR/AcrR family transcriptional regulator n=1 Tax=Kocuria rhizosphaerae TaxID=3376285 RepID=UPI0037A4E1F0